MAEQLTVLVGVATQEKVRTVQNELGAASNLSVFCLPQDALPSDVDALYLSLPRAEPFGSRPIPPYTVAPLKASEEQRRDGYPAFVLTGMIIEDDDDPWAPRLLPRLFDAVKETIAKVNGESPGSIRRLAILEYELTFGGKLPLADATRQLERAFGNRAAAE